MYIHVHHIMCVMCCFTDVICSCCNLASHCLKAEFRQRFRARSLTSRVLQALKDAPGQKVCCV